MAEFEEHLTGKKKKSGAGRPSMYPKCKDHGNTIYKFTDKTPTIPARLKPVYTSRGSKAEAGDSQTCKRKAKAQPGGPQAPAPKKPKPIWALQEDEPEPGGSHSSSTEPKVVPELKTDKVTEWAAKIARDIYSMRVPDARYNHHMMSELLMAQHLNRQQPYTGRWLQDFVLCKAAARVHMQQEIWKAARLWTREAQEREVCEGKRREVDPWEVFYWEKGGEEE